MKTLATGLLVAMTAVFLAASSPFAHRWNGSSYVRAFAEAAMVGACADWFAVTALFRRPFGLPIPHTAVIPRSKDRIGEALGRFIVENFLDPKVLDAKLRELELAAWGGDWLSQPQNARALAARLVRFGPELVRALPEGALEELLGSLALGAGRSIPAAPTASAVLAAIWNKGQGQALIEQTADLLGGYLAEHHDVILEKVQGQSWRWLPGWVDKAIARKITAGLVQLLADVRQPDHPWRAEFGQTVETLIARLAHDPELRRQGEALKQQVLEDPRIGEQARRLWSEMRRQLATDASGGTAAFVVKVEALVLSLGAWLRDDVGVQRMLNTGARSLVRRGVAPRRMEIGRFVAQVVESWDARDVVERLELKVGPDLQYIRLNGTIVGGLVGLGLFAFSRLFGLA